MKALAPFSRKVTVCEGAAFSYSKELVAADSISQPMADDWR